MARQIWVNESPYTMIEGESIAFSHEWAGASSVSSVASTLWKDGEDYSSTGLSGSDSDPSNNIQTARTVTAQSGDSGSRYVLEFQAVVDGNTLNRKLEIIIVSASDEQS